MGIIIMLIIGAIAGWLAGQAVTAPPATIPT